MWFMATVAGRAGLRVVASAPDRRLMERIAQGDEGALRELYDLHVKAMYSLAVRILRSSPDAEDVVQEVFSQAWRQSARYDATRASAVGWLLMQTRSRAIDRLRARQARPEGSEVDVVVEQADSAAGPELQAVRTEQANRVRLALERLPFLQRTAIELAYYEGLTQSEIAERLAQPLGTVKTWIRQGLLRLREALNEDEESRNGR